MALRPAYFYPSLRGRGLPRRFAPRNDMQKFAACSHCKDALGQKRGTFHPCPEVRKPTRFMDVIANQCAHWCGNPFSPQRSLASWHYFGQIRGTLSRIRLRHCPPSCPTAGVTDCHVASLLAMTCKRLSRCYVCKRVLPGQARNRPRIRPTSCLFLPVSAGMRIATSLRSSQ